MFVSLGNITPPVTDLNTIAGWMLGTVLVLVVAGIFVGLWAWITGKSFNVSDWAMKGKVTLGLCVIAAMLLGSLVPGITWASKEEWTLALLPDGAGKRDIRVDTEAPASKCQNRVGIKAEDHRKATDPGDAFADPPVYMPTDEEAHEMYSVIKSIGARDWDADEVKTKTLTWGARTGDIPSADDWKKNWYDYKEKHEPKYSAISWQPDGLKGPCDNTNHHAAPGAKIEVVFYEAYTKATGDKGKPNYTKAEYGYRWFSIPVPSDS